MTVDPRKRQKKLERKAAKDKARKKEQKQRSVQLSKTELIRAAASPILDCCAQEVIWSEGIGAVLISRQVPNGVAFASFLVDAFCLGVKDVAFGVVTRQRYAEYVLANTNQYDCEPLSPSCARKLVEGAVEYAHGLGLAPHPDYEKARVIFGDADASHCDRIFEYGREGKPFFVSGPRDTPERCRRVIATLRESCGAGNFDFVAGGGGMSELGELLGLPGYEE